MLLHLICSPGEGYCQIQQQGRANPAALVVAGAGAGVMLDTVASSTRSSSEAGPALLPWSWLRSVSWLVSCSIRWPVLPDPAAKLGWRCVLVVIVAGVVLDAVVSSTSKGGPVRVPWS
jgi:hypothetical protein